MAMLIRICDVNRRTSMIKAVPTYNNLKAKGNQYFNIIVDRVVLESDGTAIIEDEVVEICAKINSVFMLLSSEQSWVGRNEIIQIYETHQVETVENEPSPLAVPDETTEFIVENNPLPSTSVLPDEPTLQISTPKRKLTELEADDSLLDNIEMENNSNNNDSTKEVQTATTTTEDKNDASVVYQLATFKVDWNAISDDILQQLVECNKNKLNLQQNTYNRLTIQIVEQIRKISSKIPFKLFSRVALLATKKYPILQDTDDDGNLIGEGSLSFADKMRQSNNYIERVLRTKKTPSVPKGKSIAGVDISYQKSGNSFCSKNDLAALKRSSSNNLSEELLNSTSSFIRYKLDNTELKTLVKELPIIRSSKLLNYHFIAATQIDPSIFTTHFTEKREKLIKVTRKNRKQRESETLTDTEVFIRISNYLNEKFESMFMTFQEGTTLEEVKTNNMYPTILAFDEGDNNNSYYIQTDNTIVSQKVETIVNAVKLCLIVYFVYYLKYPVNLSKTLEFLQLYLLKLNIKESRVTPKKGCTPRKGVVALIKKLSKSNNRPDASEISDSEQQ
uniref:(northern house mosquito) hypothetical protein n=1 Tax=Culex pipiens TaxID=7175 RepID=A0A8D8AWB9_CULPI